MRCQLPSVRFIVAGLLIAVLPVAVIAGENEEKIRKALGERTEMDFGNTPLADIVNYFSDRHKIDIKFDHQVLKDAGVNPSSAPVTISTIGSISLRSALNLILNDLELTYAIENEVLLITTKEKADTMLHARVYDVRDLTMTDDTPREGPDFDSLIELITSTIYANTWSELGGPASIECFDKNGIYALVISQTDSAHDEIEKLLADLRKLKPAKPMER
jgi:hypothetical protein